MGVKGVRSERENRIGDLQCCRKRTVLVDDIRVGIKNEGEVAERVGVLE